MTPGRTAGNPARGATLRAAVEHGAAVSLVTCGRCGDTQVIARRTVLADPRRVVRCGRCDELLARVGDNATARWLALSGVSDRPFPQTTYDTVLRSPANR